LGPRTPSATSRRPTRTVRGWYLLERVQYSSLLTNPPTLANAAPVVLANNLISLHIRYFDGDNWSESWDSTSLPPGRSIPLQVAIDLKTGSTSGSAFALSTAITLPMAFSNGDSSASCGSCAGRARRSERGMALLATLLAVALMTILVVDFATSAALGYRSAANQANELRALYLARSGIQVGVALLERDSFSDALQQQAYDSLKDVWAIPTPPIPVDGGTVSVSIVDEARKLNINQLYDWRAHQINDNYAQMIARLFEGIGVTTDLIPIIVDWLDPGQHRFGGRSGVGLLPCN
jgi:hypothetical protein